MTRTLKRLALAGLFLLPLGAARLAAQTPTPEGTVIKNVASATYTDANGNAYAAVKDSASVTVGFLAGPNPSAAAATATPAAGSTGNTMTFTIKNSGNGTDNFQLSEPAHAGVSVTSYTYNGTAYATLALLNTYLNGAGAAIVAGGSHTLVLTYDVTAGTGGTSIPVTIAQASVRTPSSTASATTTVNPPAARSVNVTPDALPLSLLPRGTVYTQTFTIQNTGNSTDSYTFSAGVSSSLAGAVTISTVNGVAATTGSVGPLAAGASTTIDVTYFVNNTVGAATVPAGTTASVSLTATSTTLGTVTDPGNIAITVVRAAITLSKVAYLDNLSAPIGASLVLPGQYIQYKITVANGSGATAVAGSNIAVSDVLPAEVTYDSVVPDAAGWSFTGTSTVTANLSGTLATGASRFFYIRVKVK